MKGQGQHKVGIVGATGYTGLILIQYLLAHPNTEIVYLAANRSAGESIFTVYPQLVGTPLLDIISGFEPSEVPVLDTLFLAMPHGQSHCFMDRLMANDHIGRIIDLSADFRLSDASLFHQYYGVDHASKSLLGTVPLGIPELYSDQIRAARLVACPGCYSTSVILGLYPLAQAGLLGKDVIVDSKSGISGAGRKVSAGTSYCEVNESVTAYGTGNHRHSAEIEMVLGRSIIFSPHLVPMMRGILSSCYFRVPQDSDCLTVYRDFYQSHSFIQLNDSVALNPSTKYVVGTNRVAISFRQLSSEQWVVFVAIDNLVKGASGQAIQVMNVMNGWPEELGLSEISRYL